ncbi:Uncharacterised protein [Kluyvera cryocrescens]|nr:Uncharacterised protein [Kluyvera cryocrescens]
MLVAQANKVHQLVLRVRRIGVMHRRATVSEAPFWPKQGFTGQTDERFGHIQHALAGKQVVIDITGLGLPAAIGGVIIINFVTQIQPAAAQVIVKQPEAHIVTAGDGERNMFVQRVGADGVIAHGIKVAHLVALAAALQVARFIAQAVEALVLTTALVVGYAVSVGVDQIGAGRTVAHQRLPLTFGITIVPLNPQRLVDGGAQGFGGDHKGVVLLNERPAGQGKAAEIFAVAAFPRNILLWRDAPSAIQRQFAFAF